MADKSITSKNFVDQIETELILGDTQNLEKAYTSRASALTSMPHSKTKDLVFARKNGDFELEMRADPRIGLPYGVYPRYVLAFIVTEAVRTKSKIIRLGESFAGWMRDLGITPSAGNKGTKKALRDQVNRLFSTSISFKSSSKERDVGLNFFPVEKYELWWGRHEENLELGESTITLGEIFFKEIIEHPVVFYLDALKALKKSPLAIDIYIWLTYKNSYSKNSTFITWEQLQRQFGSGYPENSDGKRDFKVNFKKAFKKVMVVYHEAKKIDLQSEGLLFRPGEPHVPKLEK